MIRRLSLATLLLLPLQACPGGPTGPGGGEICGDDIDNDRDGNTDEGEDADGDGYLTCDIEELVDCDDGDADVHPQALEECDGIDNDCDGETDNLDRDGDDRIAEDCGGDDCDDNNGDVYPGRPEGCDGADNDCDDEIDEGFDADDDGWTFCAGDCRDSDPFINPDAEELCDGEDNDCNGDTDEAFDGDEDGFVDASNPFCEDLYGPGGANQDLGDCDDENDQHRPGAHEDPTDGVDNDCDGCTDECEDFDLDGWDNCDASDEGDPTCPHDTGNDGQDADCVDTSLQFNFQTTVIHPDTEFQVADKQGDFTTWPELCDDVDNDCNGEIDEGYDPATCNPKF